MGPFLRVVTSSESAEIATSHGRGARHFEYMSSERGKKGKWAARRQGVGGNGGNQGGRGGTGAGHLMQVVRTRTDRNWALASLKRDQNRGGDMGATSRCKGATSRQRCPIVGKGSRPSPGYMVGLSVILSKKFTFFLIRN